VLSAIIVIIICDRVYIYYGPANCKPKLDAHWPMRENTQINIPVSPRLPFKIAHRNKAFGIYKSFLQGHFAWIALTSTRE